MFTVSPEQAILFTKFSVALVCTWPPSINSSKSTLKFHDVFWLLSFISTLLLFFPLLQATYVYKDDSYIMTQSICLAAGVIQGTIKMLLCRILQHRFQVLFSDMKKFCANANEEERGVLQRYVNRYKILYGIYTCWTYFAAIVVVMGPVYMPQPLPCFAVYPIPVDEHPVKTIIFLHQGLVGLQTAAATNVDCQIGILLWFTVARFEMLSLKINNLPGEKYLNECYKYHQDVLRYAQSVQNTVSYVAATSIIATAIGIAFGGINLVRQSTPMTAKVQFSAAILVACVELFMCTLPADHLKNAVRIIENCIIHLFAVYQLFQSSQIAIDMYNSKWYERSIQEQKSAVQFMMRCQKPEKISLNGLVTELTLRYYSSFLYTSFSYIATIRQMVAND